MDAYVLAVLTLALIYCLLTLGLNLQYGVTGLVNFGHVAFFAIGAYTSALLSMNGIPKPLAFLAAAALAAAAAAPLGFLSLRLRDDYLAIVTLGFSESVRLAIQQEAWLTNGVQGIAGVSALFEGLSGQARQWVTFLVIAATVALAAWGTYLLVHSAFGRALRAIRDDEVAVAALGKDPAGFKIKVFCAGAALAGLAGAFYAHYLNFISPEQFVPLVTFYIWMSLIMGGAGSVRGALAGTLLLVLFLEGSRFARDLIPGVSEVHLASVRLALIGLALVLFTMLRPHGLFGLRRS